MKRPRFPLRPVLAAAGAVLLLSAAGCRHTVAVRFFVLSPTIIPPSAPAEAAIERPIVLDAVHMPAYLDRSEMVFRTGVNELRLSEFCMWAQPVAENVEAVLAENLNRLLGVRIHDAREARHIPQADRVSVVLQRFEGMPGKSVVTQARWQIVSPSGAVRHADQYLARDPIAEADPARIVMLQSQHLARLAESIAVRFSEIPDTQQATAEADE
jgi:uncharacterized lipoprotein YmbA